MTLSLYRFRIIIWWRSVTICWIICNRK